MTDQIFFSFIYSLISKTIICCYLEALYMVISKLSCTNCMDRLVGCSNGRFRVKRVTLPGNGINCYILIGHV